MKAAKSQYLAGRPDDDFANVRMAEFGCGPGLLLKAISAVNLPIKSITCIDKSKGMLEKAVEVGKELGISVIPIEADLRNMRLKEKFDIIISANAVLPSSRSEAVEIFKTFRAHLSNGGRLLAILPAFEATQYLENLWAKYYARQVAPWHGERVREGVRLSKKVNVETCSYADDGLTTQCYHTKKTITDEFGEAKLRLASEIQEVYYPWTLSRKFDYGDFGDLVNQLMPDSPKEIWDWFVVAEREP